MANSTQGDELFLIERPSLLLALSLSAPARAESEKVPEKSFSVEVTRDRILITPPFLPINRPQPTWLLCSKETICFALLIHEFWRTKGGIEVETLLKNQLLDLSSALASQVVRRRNDSIISNLLSGKSEIIEPWFRLKERLDLDDTFVRRIDEECREAFQTLEDRGLVVDPGFTPDPLLIILLGMLPVQWSVRTLEGERILRQINVVAPLWSLRIATAKRGGRPNRDWEFELRGINFIRNLLTTMAQHYLNSEFNSRHGDDKPTLEPPQDVSLDRERHDS